MTASGSVRAEVRYLNDEWKEREDRPFIYDPDTRRRNTTRHEVEIIDARDLTATGTVNVEANGLTFARHETSVRDFHDAEAVRASYETEIAPMLQAATGAREVFVQSHQVRTEDPETFLGAYSRYIHCDYPLHPMQDRERNLLRQHCSALANEVESLDFAWFNIWEPIERPAVQNQLTILDAASTAPEDFQEYHFTQSATGGYAAIPTRNSSHRFFYFSRMQPGEAAIFKQYDSRPNQPMVCPHTAFYDPSVGEDHPGRRSVEFRALAIY